jgi:hypothetical protein
MKSIKLGDEVIVSDPCYELPTWCQAEVKNVLPGNYRVMVVKSDQGDWGNRCSHLIAIHEKYCHQDEKFKWGRFPAQIGVDSGQAGVFSKTSYRKDEVFEGQKPNFDYQPWKDDGGEIWYAHMCDRTLNNEQWGVYNEGVVSSSGYGDGSYELLVAKKKNKIIGFVIDFYLNHRSIKKVVNDEFLTRV